MIKAVIFDMDGVLVDSEPKYMERRIDFFKSKGYENISYESQLKFIGSNPKDMCKMVEPVSIEKQEKLRRDYRHFSKNYKIDFKEVLDPNIAYVFRSLKEMGLSLAIASSSSMDTIKKIVDLAKASPYLDLILTGDDFSKSKPNPTIYKHSLRELGLSPKEALVVEDSKHGITAGKAAGIKVVARRTDLQDQSQADFFIDQLEELLDLVKKENSI